MGTTIILPPTYPCEKRRLTREQKMERRTLGKEILTFSDLPVPLVAAPLYLQVACTKEAYDWAQLLVERSHYLGKQVFPKSMPMPYIVLQPRGQRLARVGTLIYNHAQCRYVKQWFGSWGQKQAGDVQFTIWELINLARVYLDASIQEETVRGEKNRWYVYNAASRVVTTSLYHVVYDYLLFSVIEPC